MIGYALPALVYLVVLVLHLAVPARVVDGYVKDDDGRPLRYRLNGLRVFLLTLAGFAAACAANVLPWELFYLHRWPMAISACVLGLAFSAWIVALGAPTGKGLLADFYLGRLPNPRWRGVDAKMYLYLVGATLLALNLGSFAAFAWRTHADHPPGVIVHCVLFGWFLVDYLWFEEVHLYTYDFFAERVGYKLGWGCLVFYPLFYACGLWAVADRGDPHAATAIYVAAALFFAGWSLSRGANLQKFLFKTRPEARLLGVVRSEAITSGDHRLLVSGFWGVSRHVNYLGEILMASGLALSLGWPTAIGPWLYPVYYLALLIPRELDDDRRCAQKYGPLWDEYRRRVRWRIVPGIY